MRTTIYIHEKVWETGKAMAEADYRSFSYLVSKLILEEAKRQDITQPPKNNPKDFS